MTHEVLRFTVPGEPVAKGRARTRVVARGGGAKAFAMHYTPSETVAFETRVLVACRSAAALHRWRDAWTSDSRFALMVRVFRTHEGRGGDIDNYVKAVSDGMNGEAFPDDRYVRSLSVMLIQDAAHPRVEVEVHRFENAKTKERKVANG